MAIKIAPIKSSMMLVSILGFIISAMVIYDKWPAWGFAFVIVFVILFVASLISMTYAPIEELPKKGKSM